MANTRGMGQFVARQNPDDKTRKSEVTAAFKVNPNPSKRQAANTTASRDNNNGVKRTRSSVAEEMQQNQPFWGTNASSIDKTSTSGQMNKSYPPNWHATPAQDHPESENHEGAGVESGSQQQDDYGGGEQDSAEDEEFPPDPLQANNRRHSHERDDKNLRLVHMRHLPGDSYPDTTSGPHTIAEGDDAQQDDHSAQAQCQGTQPTNLPTRGASGTRLLQKSLPNLQQQSSQQSGQQTHNQQQSAQFRLPTNADDVVADVNSGFSFGPAPHKTARPQAQGGQQPNTAQPSHAIPSNVGQNGSAIGPESIPPPDAYQKPHVQPPRPGTPQQHGGQQRSKQNQNPRLKSAQTNPAEQASQGRGEKPLRPIDDRARQAIHPPQPQNQHQGHEQPRQRPQQGLDQQQYRMHPQQLQQLQQQAQQHPQQHRPEQRDSSPESEISLDYEPEEIVRMSYKELKAQPLDVDPDSAPFDAFPDGTSDADDLQKKLAAVATLSIVDQTEFFTSLDVDAWEEAGEWFLQKFADLTKQLKDNRREKRKAVEALEDEISERHTAVSKKCKLTDNALSEMKESGGKVLQGTPKKTRKSK